MEEKRIGEAVKSVIPACSVSEKDGTVTVRLEMPGVSKDRLEVRVEGNSLFIFGSRDGGAETGRYLVRERRGDAFRKTFTLDDSIARESIGANLSNGVLTLDLRLKEAAKPRKIEVR